MRMEENTKQAALVVFASWHCGCTMLAATFEEIPDYCPVHVKGLLLGRREWTSNPHNVPFGFRTAS